MGWERLQRRLLGEPALQRIFENWNQGAPQGYVVSGVPDWLSGRDPVRGSQMRVNNEYLFTPDLRWKLQECGRTWIVELKSAFKWQPLGLPEVLHHVAVINGPMSPAPELRGKVDPLLITEHSGWMLAALQFLRDEGSLPTSFRYLDFRYLLSQDSGPANAEAEPRSEDPSVIVSADLSRHEATEVQERPGCLWFDDVLEQWEPVGSPPANVLDPTWAGNCANWFCVRTTNTWIATIEGITQRPIWWTSTYVQATSIRGTGDSLIWIRDPQNENSQLAREGEFWLWTPGESGYAGPPVPKSISTG